MRFIVLLIILAALYAGYHFYLREPDRATDSPPATAGEEGLTDQPGDARASQENDNRSSTTRTSRDGFTPPDFEPLEAAVGNWLDIPASAFPREVTLDQPVTFRMEFGSSTLPPGANAIAIGSEQGQLVVAPSANASVRSRVEIDSTDYKDILAGEYNEWKARMTERARKQWKYQQTAAKTELRGQEAVEAAREAGVGDPPPADPYDAARIIRSELQANPLNELKPDFITGISEPALIDVEGRRVWAITVDFVAQTRFGPYPTQAQALLTGDRVDKWIYTGSGEPVP